MQYILLYVLSICALRMEEEMYWEERRRYEELEYYEWQRQGRPGMPPPRPYPHGPGGPMVISIMLLFLYVIFLVITCIHFSFCAHTGLRLSFSRKNFFKWIEAITLDWYVTSTLTLRIGNQNLYLLCCCREWEDQTPQMTAMWCQNMPVFIQMKLRYTNDIYSIYKVSLPENFHLVIGLTFMIICWSCNVNCIYDELLIL